MAVAASVIRLSAQVARHHSGEAGEDKALPTRKIVLYAGTEQRPLGAAR